MIERTSKLNVCLAVAVGAILLTLILGALQKSYGIFDGADATAIRVVKSLRTFPALTFVMLAITSFGSELTIMVVTCILYWLGHTTEMIGFLLVVLFGNVVNSHLKEFFELSRPQAYQITWLAKADGYGYPSGHSMIGMVYSWIIYEFLGRYWYVCLIPALLMAASRIYLGVHFFSDTVGGLLCGLGVVAAATGIYSHVHGQTSLRQSIRGSTILKVVLSLALSLFYLFVARGLPGAFNYAGFLAGFFIVYSMLRIRWRSRNPFLTIIVAVVGMAILLAVRIGVKQVLPESSVSDYCRYFLLGVMLAGSPLLFVRIGLLKRVQENMDAKESEP